MLSTKYRLRLEAICQRIATGQTVELQDRIWANKLGEANRTAASMLRQAQRRAQNPVEVVTTVVVTAQLGGDGEDFFTD